MQAQDAIPHGYCHCGCGEKTGIIAETSAEKGWIKGEPKRFINGHNGRVPFDRKYVPNDESGCWDWIGDIASSGYGVEQKTVDGKRRRVSAHRVMYEREIGPIPANAQIDHTCNNRSCVNPDHLEAVTQKENIRRRPSMKLTWDDVRAIRASSLTQIALGEIYGITPQYVGQIQAFKAWQEDTGLADSFCPTAESLRESRAA